MDGSQGEYRPVDENTTVTYKRLGRKPGSKNYGSISVVARAMRARGMEWVDEFIGDYRFYKAQLRAWDEDSELNPKPDPTLVMFWVEVMPYITVRMIDRDSRGKRPKYYRKRPHIGRAALAALAKAERGDK